jgi:hypothetical protein
MDVKRIHGALNVEFGDHQCVSFTILDRECDECISRKGGCKGCENVGKPWKEYYQLLRYNFSGNEAVMHENNPTKAIRQIIRILQRYLDLEEDKVCFDTEK